MSNSSDTGSERGPLPGLLRPPLVFLSAILLGVIMNLIWPLPVGPPLLVPIGIALALAAVVLFSLSLREFRAAGTSVRGSERTTTIVGTGPYRFSRNPIYLSFVTFQLGLALSFNNVWLLITLAPAAAFIATMIIPREEQFLERNFQTQYADYKASVRRWL
jgi:protein-S-isoprenylcysteine O-methyltransferase Ste14